MEKMANENKSDCLNFMRLIAAFQVFWGHAVEHLDIAVSHNTSRIMYILQGVPIFFIISGFLIWASLRRNRNFKFFAKKRMLRLYPELWGGVLLCAITIIILYGQNLNWVSFTAWIFTQSTVLQFWTPACLRGFGCGTPNGALWTIGVIIQSYVVIYLLYKFLHKSSLKKWIIIILAGIGMNIAIPLLEGYIPEIVYKLLEQTFIPYIWIFIIGALLQEYFEKIIEILKKHWYLFFAGTALVSYFKLDIGRYGTLKVLFLAPALIGFAYRYGKLNVKHDVSYGLYIYHMIIINVMIEFGMTSKLADFFIAFGASAIMAIVSYYSIGKLSRLAKGQLKKSSYKLNLNGGNGQ